MKKRFSFEVKITVILAFILVLVTLTGMLAYNRFSSIVSNFSNGSRYDMRIVDLKNLEKDLSLAESNVKSYSLSKDTVYVHLFNIAIRQAENKLADLKNSIYTNSDLRVPMDSIYEMVENKFRILNDLLLIQDQYRVQVALDKVENKIENAALKIDESNNENIVSEKKRKKNLLNLFRRKKEAEEEKANNISEKITLMEVSKEVDKVRQEEQDIELMLKNLELGLIKENEIVSQNITNLINTIEGNERSMMAKRSELAESTLKETNFQIAGFCVLIAVLLFFISWVIINYVKNNNRYRDALRKAKKEAEDLVKTKERFFANMSHEIRTPMNAIAGFTEQLADTEMDHGQRQKLTVIQKSVDHLLNIINDVLDYSKLKAGKLKLEQKGFRIRETIKDVFLFSETLAKNKKIELSVDIDENVPEIFIGDEVRFRQILLNLVSNSVKFTSVGNVKLIASGKPDRNLFHLKIQVIDTGIGMTEKELQKVFDEFEQVEENTTRNYGGTGLGLSITHKLVELHNGTISISSEKGIGTTVEIELAYKTGSTDDMYDQLHEISEESMLQNLKVLVVDDEKYNRQLIKLILKKYHAIYAEANNGQFALQQLEQDEFDLILMDVRMPLMNGIETVEKIRKLKNKKKSKIPVIAITAAISSDDQQEYEKVGMNAFLPKPFTERELIRTINEVLQKININQKLFNNITQ